MSSPGTAKILTSATPSVGLTYCRPGGGIAVAHGTPRELAQPVCRRLACLAIGRAKPLGALLEFFPAFLGYHLFQAGADAHSGPSKHVQWSR